MRARWMGLVVREARDTALQLIELSAVVGLVLWPVSLTIERLVGASILAFPWACLVGGIVLGCLVLLRASSLRDLARRCLVFYLMMLSVVSLGLVDFEEFRPRAVPLTFAGVAVLGALSAWKNRFDRSRVDDDLGHAATRTPGSDSRAARSRPSD